MQIKLPSNVQSEMFLIARMLSSIDCVNESIGSLQSSDFVESKHQVIFDAIRSLYSKDCEIEPMSVASEMSKMKNGSDDVAYLFGLRAYQFGDHSEVKIFIDNILEASRLRKLIHIGSQISFDAAGGEKTAQQVQVSSLTKIENIFSGDFDKGVFTMPELLKKDFAESGKEILSYLEDQMEKHRRGIKNFRGIPCGFYKLDNILSGFCRGHFIVVGARPGIGKTTFCLNLILKLAKKGVKVGFFSLEMTAEEAQMKMLCIDSGLNSEKVSNGSMSHDEYRQIVVSAKTIGNLNIVIDQQESLTISQLISRAKRMVIANGIEILFIDYLGEIKGDGKFANKQEEIQSVSKGLRGLAKKLKIPIVCIAQLNRDTEKENRTPRKSDLRESGQIEADAHSILLLHRPSADDTMDQPAKVYVYIVKNRFGREDCVHFAFEGDKGRFSEIDYRQPQQIMELDEDDI